jgi:hypothetical protein
VPPTPPPRSVGRRKTKENGTSPSSENDEEEGRKEVVAAVSGQSEERGGSENIFGDERKPLECSGVAGNHQNGRIFGLKTLDLGTLHAFLRLLESDSISGEEWKVFYGVESFKEV